MPELPEVEVTRRRVESGIVGKVIARIEIRAAKLRLPVPVELTALLLDRTIRSVCRRGKYLLFDCGVGTLIIHLGMTGYLRLQNNSEPAGKHDHFELGFNDGTLLRLHDPRKFGTVAWTTDDPLQHPLLSGIGLEPMTGDLNADYLFTVSRTRRIAIKQLIMDAATVAGIGNIYANESLFRAGIRPDRHSCSITHAECNLLAAAVRQVLQESIDHGSTYSIAEGSTSYHPLEFSVYGRSGEPCIHCGNTLKTIRLGSRSTFFCARCQL